MKGAVKLTDKHDIQLMVEWTNDTVIITYLETQNKQIKNLTAFSAERANMYMLSGVQARFMQGVVYENVQ